MKECGTRSLLGTKKDYRLVDPLIPVDPQVITEAEGLGIEMKEKIIDPRIEVLVTLVEITGILRIMTEILDLTDLIMMIIEIPQGPPITGEGPDPHLTEKDINKR